LPPLAGVQPAPDHDDGEPPEVPVPEIVEELPCWAEMAAILRLELDGPAPRDLERFRREVYAGLPQAQEATKVGGWATWLRDVESVEPLFAQITPFDHGTLFLYRAADGALTLTRQFY
jgi:hypothetical protein